MKDNNPLVSIFCLTFNHRKFIGEALEGFVIQKTNFPYEVIIYDDCSTDGNQDIIREYAEKYPDKVRAFLSDVNHYTKGPKCFSYYKYLEMARGKYVAICEGDDYWIDPFKLQKQVDLFRAKPDMTYCFSNRIVRNDITVQERIERYSTRKYTQKDFLSGFNPGLQTVMFEIDKIRDVDFTRYQFVNGDRLFPYICTKDGYALCIQEEMAVYRVSPVGVSTAVSINTTPSEYFRHACDDFYRYHENMGFPYKRGYMRSSANYAKSYLAKRKGFDTHLFYEMTSRYNGRKSAFQSIETSVILVNTIIGKVLEKSCAKFFHVWNRFTNLFKKERFCSLILELTSIDDISKNRVVKKLEVPKYSLGNKPTTIADIFLFSKNEKLYAFYEYQNKRNAKGLIYMVCSKDGQKWTTPKKVLEETVHLSFPFVFEDKGSIYMIPETSYLKEIRLYKSNEDLTDFSIVKTLVSGGRFVDSCIYIKDGVYYLFTSVQFDDNSYELWLYYCDSLEGDWRRHPSTPLSKGKADARNAGCIIDYNGMILRPAQECRKFYGQNTHLFRIKELSKQRYSEEPFVLDLIPKGWQDCIGGHQLSVAYHNGKTYAGIDLLKYTYRASEIFQKIKSRL